MPFNFCTWDDLPFDTLKGKTIKSIEFEKCGDFIEAVIFITEDTAYKLFHNQSCCESVDLYDLVGDWDDLIGHPILVAEEYSQSKGDEGVYATNHTEEYSHDSFTWTFYKLATIKGFLDMRWYGHSNGYYSERVTLVGVEKESDDS